METWERQIELAKQNKWEICCYGMGIIGKAAIDNIFPLLDIKIDFFCDRNMEKEEEIKGRKEKWISVDELINTTRDSLVFIMVGKKYDTEVEKILCINSKIHIIKWTCISKSEGLLYKYFTLPSINHYEKKNTKISRQKVTNTEKIAVYTCITGNYDKLNSIKEVEKNIDYYLITDVPKEQAIENDNFYKRIFVDDIVPKSLKSHKDKNRYCKSHGFELFSDYDYSIYIDGSLQIVGRVSDFISLIGEIGIGMHRCMFEDDIYFHAMSLSNRHRIDKLEANYEILKMANNGFPMHFGMVECGVIVCNHANETGVKLLKQWNQYYNSAKAKRDQLYMPYILWKNGVTVEEIAVLPGDLRTNGYFEITTHHDGFQK